MAILWLDFETRSRCDLTSAGAYNYAQDPSTQVLCMSYAFGDAEVETWMPGQRFPDRVAHHRGQIRAHNAAFERLIFWYVLAPDQGFREPALEQFYCTAAQARANCGPGSLEDVGRFAGASMKKDHRGAQLIRALSIPRPDGTFREDAALLAEMVQYCEQDVRAMRAVSKAMRDLSDEELLDYHVNERINDRGVLVDTALCQAAVRYAGQELVEIEQTVREVTAGAITSVRSPKMRAWVEHRVGPQARKLMIVHKDGEAKVSIDKNVRANLLVLAAENSEEVPPDVAEVIQCADDLWASSVAKFNRLAALADAEDGRVRGAFVFAGGAATGRACVSAQTLVESEYGRRPISALDIGEKVLTHAGRFCKVTRVIYKGRQVMYRVVAASGGWVDCTEDHLLLTDKGWRSVKELICYTKPRDTAEGDGAIHVATVSYDGGSWPHDRPNPRNCLGNRAGDRTAGAVTHPESGELLEIEDGRQEPYVWCAEASRGDLAARVSLPLDGRRYIPAGASSCADARARADAMAGGLGSASHRQRQDKQRVGQLSGGDKSRAPEATFSEVREIICVGEKGVWDISVEGDASYVAQGLVHHNSSYGAQVHNFPRKCAAAPEDVRQAMVRGHQIVPAYGRRVTDVLKGMLRPALLPAPGKVLIAADWSAIEARVNPWLSKSNSGAEKLGIFERGEDVYKVNAAATFRVAAEDVTKDQRQVGKVQELACGFAGGVGAFAAMGRIYGINLPESEARKMVDAWRRANSWSVPFWQGLEEAYTRAMRNRGHEFSAGRITYLFDGQHLWYALPSGRVLCYPFARLEPEGVTYAKASWKPAADAKEWPRARLWRGLACENVTQATAHDLLRHALRQLEAEGHDVVLHVHDEVVVETNDPEAAQAAMQRTMCSPPAWAAGIPLNIEAAVMSRYGK
jgi:DNA polymerase I-like protein with 3'-5' exonuclease and polymerase domains